MFLLRTKPAFGNLSDFHTVCTIPLRVLAGQSFRQVGFMLLHDSFSTNLGTSFSELVVDTTVHVSASKRYHCDFSGCDYSTSRLSHLPGHKNRHHLDSKPYSCDECDYTAATKSEVYDHSWKHKDEKRFTCEYCGWKTNWSSSRRKHIRSKHTGERPYKCDYGKCSYDTISSSKLNRHINAVHLDHRPYSCQDCDYSAVTKYKLKEHRRKHTGEKPYHCDFCDKNFARNATLKDHHRVHTGEEPYVCDIDDCGASFKSRSNFNGHQKAVHINLRPHICDQCDYRTAFSSNLEKHKRIHEGIRPFICEECKEAFTSSSGLNRHNLYENDERNFHCEECEKSFITSRDLKVHLLRDSNIRDYECEGCSAAFVSQGELNVHLKRKACWYTEQSWKQWEALCVDKIAPLLYNPSKYEVHPKIETPNREDSSWIQPEIFVRDSGGTVIIDAKRTSYATSYKDLVIYPDFADQVEFWCLFGSRKTVTEDGTELIYRSSEDLITMLKSNSTGKPGVTRSVIAEIRSLQTTD